MGTYRFQSLAKLFLLGISFCLALVGVRAAHVGFAFQSSDSSPQGLRSVSIYPTGTFTNGNGIIITRDRVTGSTDTNGSLTVSNIYGGDYRGELQGTFTVTTNWYHFPVTNGLIRAADYLSPPATNGGVVGYSQAQADGKFLSYSLTNVVVITPGEDTNTFIVTGAGTTSANGTNRLKTRDVPVPGFLVFTNVNGLCSVVRDPNDVDTWSITNGSGILYNSGGSEPPNQTWQKINGANPVPTSATTGYGPSTNSFTNFFSTAPFPLPWPVTENQILYVRTNGNNYSAVRGDPTRAWKSFWRAYTNATRAFDLVDVGPGVFDERAEFKSSPPTPPPANLVIAGSGPGATMILGNNGSVGSVIWLGNSNVLQNLSIDGAFIYISSFNHCTNVIISNVSARDDGDVILSDQGAFYCWDPWIINCNLAGSSDKIAILETAGLTGQTNSHIYIVNTTIQGGPGADGDGMNRGNTTPNGVRFGNFVPLGVHVMVSGGRGTNTQFMGITSGTVTGAVVSASSGFFGPGANVTSLNGANMTANTLALAKIVNATAMQRIIGRNTAGSGSWEEVTATQILDWLSSTRGALPERGASGWTVITPGTSGTFLQSAGAGADPTYATPSGYIIPIITIGSATPVNGTTYYFGADSLSSLQTTYANASVKIPRAGTIKAAFFKWSITTPGTGESVAHSIRVNDTTDVSIQSVTLNAARVDVFSSSMSQAASAGDTFVMKMVSPTWATPPNTMRGQGYLYIE